ncbi:hypothetical protein HELRODRAFT_171560 [Helobdella robusta]|uniref:Uncharacterized protein n=1 Tax=Helobdella robusta TaxID=6412 RepID=T1F4E8_HELRO|nr:hypothetical protein HELRODRAFT_171560 [Helobdella robusta]ESO05213.1 hypothetical protein HELRODRAFT_171560 [Helobdella robusta]
MGKKIQCIGRYTLDGVSLGWGNFARVELATHNLTKVKHKTWEKIRRKIADKFIEQTFLVQPSHELKSSMTTNFSNTNHGETTQLNRLPAFSVEVIFQMMQLELEQV